jgi:hypothetical protein
MDLADMLILGGIITVFASFALVLGWAAHIDYKRPLDLDTAAGED